MIADQRESISSMHLNVEKLLLDDRTAAFWTDNKDKAAFLNASFEAARDNAVDR